MKSEFIINLFNQPVNIYMQNSFFGLEEISAVLHKHLYAEIHILAEGELVYQVENKVIRLHTGDVLVIPKDCFHSCLCVQKHSRHIVFQIDPILCTEVKRTTISEDMLSDLRREISKYSAGEYDERLKILLTMICLNFCGAHTGDTLKPIQDRGFIIYEFFTRNYNTDVSINDLADELSLSVKQAERMVIKFTGRTFRQEIMHRRMEAATQLMKNEYLSMAEICEKVGYHSYSGFWKALNKYNCEVDVRKH